MSLLKVLNHYNVELNHQDKTCCPLHGENTPSFQYYEDTDTWHCFGSCSTGGDGIEFIKLKEGVDFKEATKIFKEITGEEFNSKPKQEGVRMKEKKSTLPLPLEDLKELADRTVYQNLNYRGIRKETDEFFKHRSVVVNGQVTQRFYPETNEDGAITGVKCRNHPKDFTHGKIGVTGVQSQLSGQFKFKSGGKYILIVGGEEDKAAAYQMFSDLQSKRNNGNDDYSVIPVVSPTAGEGSAAKQCALNYDFLDQYDNIIIGMDNDKAGLKSAVEIAKVLPKHKVKIAKWTKKDPNQMLEEGMLKQFSSDFWNAKEYINSGIKSSSDIIDDVKEVLTAEKITLPRYMHRLESMMKRAFSHNGRIVNIIGTTSCGKSTHVNNMIYHWIFSEGMKPLIISLEMTAGEYAVDLLSLHLKKNLDWFEEGMDAWNYLEREDVKEMYSNLFYDQEGRERFRIIDDRDGDIDNLVKQIERGVSQYECNIVIIDVLTDLVRFLPREEQERHMAWQKNFVKSGVSIVNVQHTKKPERNKEGVLQKTTEYCILGTGTFSQSAHINIIINRDKLAPDDIEKNSTYVEMSKCRRGDTGEAGVWYYDGKTRQVYDREDYFSGKTEISDDISSKDVVEF